MQLKEPPFVPDTFNSPWMLSSRCTSWAATSEATSY